MDTLHSATELVKYSLERSSIISKCVSHGCKIMYFNYQKRRGGDGEEERIILEGIGVMIQRKVFYLIFWTLQSM